ncbi:MAG: type I glyceraldehyde-3-phosphate dehydrogenase [Paracoccaceae bacterium]|jgi:glyceraldehyde 3-phosphate dehydrogenase|nr:type I glyceraldehyde-3-phosphate dehydrogenase [Paracoccaceae bacterium]|tara:strand:+ start:4297 stop:5295 length:999 start_codon:yes stop_codon:yes gene_type:complete
MSIKIGINGMGRIGRCTLASIIENQRDDVQVIKINATGPIETNAHLLKYDSVHGRFKNEIKIDGDTMDIGKGPMKVFSSYDPADLDWSEVDVLLECSGKFKSRDSAQLHIDQGARKVLISSPGKNMDKTIVYGVNHSEITSKDTIISNASCTTNCLAPIAKVLNDTVGIDNGIMTTIHSYTGDQPTLDRRHSNLYRSRAAALSIIPTSTGAAKAIGEVLPELSGKLDGSALRVPTPNVSAVDLTFTSSRDTTAEEINNLMEKAANGDMKGIIAYDPDAKVSIDFNHDPHSASFAPDQTKVVGNRLVRILAWYDNEWGFSCRMVDNALVMGNL